MRDYYQRMLTEVRAARQEGLTLEQTIQRLTVRKEFPAFHDPPPGYWGMQRRNVQNLWRILDQEEQPPKAERSRD